ncbi:NAD(P)/FAD-dependent oxidoreductase [Clostridium ihumii]|uniref:NAD(P)/FAD-dependent oxidoreductase n=1 Tax=Clostridium ihumii TaxID=1470356 RepID=UPI003D337C4D
MYDVVVIGAGIIGASVARELSKYDLKVKVLDKENDVANGTTKANSAIVHAGYDPCNGTLMAKVNVKGNEMFEDLCKELDVPFKRNGSLVVAFSDEELVTLNDLCENGKRNNVKGLKVLNREEVLELEPNLNKNLKGALYAPTGGIVGPWEYTIALIENAITNGVELQLNSKVTSIEKCDGSYKIHVNNEDEFIETKYIVNAAGVYADKIHNMVGSADYDIFPRRGQYYVMDKSEGNLVSKTIFQCPNKLGKGVLVTPTVHGNLLVGPDAEDIQDREEVGTTKEALDFVREKGVLSVEGISFRDSIRNFAGLRAQSTRPDFIIEEAKDAKGFIDLAGMKSPGLSSAPAIALEAIAILKNCGCELNRKVDFSGERKQVIFMELTTEEKAKLIKENPAYGRIICRCENITEGEIIDSIRRPVGATTVDGVKKRCRPGMGRCQGGFCGPRVQEILSRELNKDLKEIVLDKNNSYILTQETKIK